MAQVPGGQRRYLARQVRAPPSIGTYADTRLNLRAQLQRLDA
ncbi:hypothetical protein [Streptomyces barringtoniae]|nr:hypothetical protein [Streptomyces barringtoniae]